MRTVLKQSDMIKLADTMRVAHCSLIGGFAVYEAGWSDERLVTEVGGSATINNVTYLRKNLIGDLPKKTKAATLESLTARIEELEAWARARPVVPFGKDTK